VTRDSAAQHAADGEHLCCFYGSEDEHFEMASAFFAGALGAGDRLLYVAREHRPEAVRRGLAQHGVDADRRVVSGQLELLDMADVCGAPPAVDLGRVLDRCRAEAVRSRSAGYPGLRIAVEMGDLVETLGSVETVTGWERRFGRVFGEAGITAICQYNGRSLDPAARERIVAEHSAMAVDDGTGPRPRSPARFAPARP
jgi:hypothetical protein